MREYRALMDGQEIATKVRIANTFFKRFIGLLCDKKIEAHEGLLIDPCNQVHTFGMKFDIDVVFVSKSGEIIHTESQMTPGKVSPTIIKCQKVLELKSGTVEKKCIMNGKRIAFDPIYND